MKYHREFYLKYYEMSVKDREEARSRPLTESLHRVHVKQWARLPQPEISREVGLNAFEADISDALVFTGCPDQAAIRCVSLRIDLVAMHPKRLGRPVLAIECDGAAYRLRVATARDHDRLRQAHVQRLGSAFYAASGQQIGSTIVKIERALAAFEDAVLHHGPRRCQVNSGCREVLPRQMSRKARKRGRKCAALSQR